MVATSPRGRVQRIGSAAIHSARWTAGVVAAVALVVGAGTTAAAAGTSRGGGVAGLLASFYRPPDPLPLAPPGALIRATIIPSAGLLPAGAVAYRVLYHSQSITGADIAVSGMVVVPGGTPPHGGFPIVAWAHGTTGLADQCAPSLGGFTSIPSLDTFLEHGMIVAATDYEGLGTPGIHPYLVGQSEAQSVLDSARAAGNLVGMSASNQVAIVGFSQGGQAALFSAQIAESYAPELFVAATVAVAPVTSLDEFVPSRPTAGPDPDSAYALMALDAWSKVYGNLPLSSALSDMVVRHSTAIPTQCSDALTTLYGATDVRRLFRVGWDSTPGVRTDAARNQPGQAPTSTPLLVVEGTMDRLTPYRTVTRFVADALCAAQDDTVQYVSFPGTGHDDVLSAAGSTIVGWISGRLALAPPHDTCRPR